MYLVTVTFNSCQDNISLENCNAFYFAKVQTPDLTCKDSLLYVGGGGCMRSLLGAIWSWNWAIYMHWSPPHLTDRALKYSLFLTFFFFSILVDLTLFWGQRSKLYWTFWGSHKVDCISWFLFWIWTLILFAFVDWRHLIKMHFWVPRYGCWYTPSFPHRPASLKWEWECNLKFTLKLFRPSSWRHFAAELEKMLIVNNEQNLAGTSNSKQYLNCFKVFLIISKLKYSVFPP